MKLSTTQKKFFLPVILLFSALFLVYACPTGINDWLFVKGVYPVVRWVQNLTFGLLPFPGFLLLGALFGLFLLKSALDLASRKNRKKGLIDIFLLVLTCLAAFFWLWGIHYGSSATKIQIAVKGTTIATSDVEKTIQEAQRTRLVFMEDKDGFSNDWQEDVQFSIASKGREWVGKTLQDLRLPHQHAAEKIRSWPEGWLLMWGVAGIYFPFTGEPGIDRGLHALKMPYTALHEWAHSHGYTGEGDCNLIAYLASMRSDEPYIMYSAQLQRLKDELYVLAALDHAAYEALKKRLPDAIISDLTSIRNHHRQYRRSFSDAGEWMNDHYLKSLGIRDGVDDYLNWVLQLKVLESSQSEQ